MTGSSTAVIAVLLALALVGSAGAITWHFDTPGDPQGRVAREKGLKSTRRGVLRSEVAEGIWRVHPNVPDGGGPTVELTSPELAAAAELFDRIELDVRLAHHSGVQATAQITAEVRSAPDASITTIWHVRETPEIGPEQWRQVRFPLWPAEPMSRQGTLHRVIIALVLASP